MSARLLMMLTAVLLLGSPGNLHAAWDFTATAIGGGSVDITTGSYNEGDTIVVTASPAANGTNAFVKWSGDLTVDQQYEPVLRLTCNGGPDGTLNVTSHFGKAWYVAATGDDANDGLALARAYATIAKGIDSASDGEVVLVDAGNYNVVTTLDADTLTVSKSITIRGLHGAEQTKVTRTAGVKPTIILSHADAVVEGLHFYKGHYRAVQISSAGGTYRKCIMSGGTYHSGQGLGVYMQGGHLSQCVITNNVGTQNTFGTGLYITGGVADNCLIADNRSRGDGLGSGVCMSGGTVRNCTIVNNVSGSGGVYASGGTMENCIVWNNIVLSSHSEVVSTKTSATFFNCHFPLLPTDNTGVFTDCILTNTAPNFWDAANGDYRLTLGSSCVDAGRIDAVATGGYDLKGNARLVGAKVDIGAYEFAPSDGLTCDVGAPLLEAVGTLAVSLSAAVSGAAPEAPLTYAWTTNNVAAGSAATLNLTLTDPGFYTVGLTVNDGAVTATTVRTNLLYVVPQTLYVVEVNPATAFPYATLETAATSIQSAIDASRSGCTVLIGAGNHLLASPLEINKEIELRSSDGPANTRVYKPKATNISLLELGHSRALISGLDFDYGYMNVVNIWSNGGVVSNCYIRNGWYTTGKGVGVYARSGLVTHCLISGNTSVNLAGKGVGAYLEGDAVVENCLITNNVPTATTGTGGGVYLTGNSVIRNCTIVANHALNGGGIYTVDGTVENCIIYDNTIDGIAGPGDPDWYNIGTAAIYRNNCTPVDIGTDCVTALPNFRDAANGDYRLSFESPCFNAGVNSVSLIGGTDYYGNPRIAARIVDIGFHELIPPLATFISIR